MKYLNRAEIIKSAGGDAGVTLIEVIIACSLTIVLFAAVFGTLTSSLRNYTVMETQINAQQTVQSAMATMQRELRQAQTPLLEVVTTQPGVSETLVFKADLNDDGTSEAIEYYYSNLTRKLTRRVNINGDFNFSASTREPIAEYVANTVGQAIFTYYGGSVTTPLDPASDGSDIINDVRMIRVRLLIDKDVAKPPAAVDMATDIKLRNFGY